MRRNWLVLLLVCMAVVMMAVLPGCRSTGGGGGSDVPETPEITEVANIDESFGWSNYHALVGWNQSSKPRKSEATGFTWNAYSPTRGSVNPITADEHYGHRIKFQGTAEGQADLGGTVPGNYVFTIFDSTGGNKPDKCVNMSSGTLYIRMDGENRGDAGEPFPAQIKILVRDGDGNWFLSNEVTVNHWDNSISFADLTWEQVASNVAEWMNKMEGGDSGAYGITAETLTPVTDGPDLTKVTGGGIYLHSVTNPTEGNIPSLLIRGDKDFNGDEKAEGMRWAAGAAEE